MLSSAWAKTLYRWHPVPSRHGNPPAHRVLQAKTRKWGLEKHTKPKSKKIKEWIRELISIFGDCCFVCWLLYCCLFLCLFPKQLSCEVETFPGHDDSRPLFEWCLLCLPPSPQSCGDMMGWEDNALSCFVTQTATSWRGSPFLPRIGFRHGTIVSLCLPTTWGLSRHDCPFVSFGLPSCLLKGFPRRFGLCCPLSLLSMVCLLAYPHVLHMFCHGLFYFSCYSGSMLI